MSRLKELIDELCPDGVEYKALGEVGKFLRGSSFQKKHFTEAGVPCIHYGQVHTQFGVSTDHVVSYLDESFAARMKRAQQGDLVIATTSEDDDAVGKATAWMGDCDVVVSNDAFIYHHGLDPMYVSYFFASDQFQQSKMPFITGAKVRRLSGDDMSKIRIPVPPIEVQREIVRILDSFQELDDALTAEIEAREKQLACVRLSKLKEYSELSAMRSLGSVAKNSFTGATPNKKNSAYYEGGTIPWLRTQEVVFKDIYSVSGRITEEALRKTACKWIPKNCVIVAISGASAGRCGINKIPVATNQHCLNLEIDETQALYRYVFHCVVNQYEDLLAMKDGPRGDLNGAKIKSLRIPVPALSDQAQIVDELDSALMLIDFLRSEREARRKQFAYYRDKLLDLPEKVTT